MLLLTLGGSPTAAAATVHYIAAAGSDSGDGSITTPWAHLPGMPSCSLNCAAYTPVAGDRFILKGGDTWGPSSLGVDWQWSGTSGARIYVGVDPSYFTGASWTRPIFNCQQTSCGSTQFGNVIWIAGSYTTFDNIEFTGYQQSSGGQTLVATYGNYNEVANFYIHGWSRTSGSGGSSSFALANNWSGGGAIGTKFHDNVIDGEDDPNKDFMGGILHGDQVYNNVIRYVYNGMNGAFNEVYGNLVEHNYVATSGDHCNMIFVQAQFTGTSVWMYNNVLRHAGCAGGMTFWMLGNTGCPGCTSYAFNNVIYDTGLASSPGIIIGSHPTSGSTGTYYIYNNTIEASGRSCIGNGEAAPRSTTHYGNNHCIDGDPCDGTGTTCVDDGGNLNQTLAEANAAGYNASQTYPYSPTASGSPTVNAGVNHSSMCSGKLAALCSDAAYATYDTVNHRVVMRAVRPRPASDGSDKWDIGAYEYSAQGPAPAPPTGLVAVAR